MKGRLCYFLVGARCLAFSGRSFFFTRRLVHLQRAALGFDGDSLISAVTSSETALFHVGLLHRIFFSPRSQLLVFRLPGTFAANKLDNQQRNWRLLSLRLGTVKPATTSVANQFHVHKRPNTSQGNSNIFRHGKSCLSNLRGKGSGTSQTLASTTKKTHN